MSYVNAACIYFVSIIKRERVYKSRGAVSARARVRSMTDRETRNFFFPTREFCNLQMSYLISETTRVHNTYL